MSLYCIRKLLNVHFPHFLLSYFNNEPLFPNNAALFGNKGGLLFCHVIIF